MARKKPLRPIRAEEKPLHPLPWSIESEGSYHYLLDADKEVMICCFNRPTLTRILDLINASTTLKPNASPDRTYLNY